jgi:hypothetical protein
MKDYFFKPSIRSFFTTLFISMVVVIGGVTTIASTNQDVKNTLLANSRVLGNLPEQEKKELLEEMSKFKKNWKENREQLMEQYRKDFKDLSKSDLNP